MSKIFRPWLVDQPQLLPRSVGEFVPEGHVAHFVRNVVRDELDLSAILAAYAEERGYPPYHPVMMTALLLYGYSRGVYSSRRLERACEERLDFLAVTAMNRPDHRTICEFRRRHLAALSDLFVQVLKLCQAAGLVRLGHVALDGTKIAANASKHKAMSYGRMSAMALHRAAAPDSQASRPRGCQAEGHQPPPAWKPALQALRRAEWDIRPCPLSAKPVTGALERWPSGRRRAPAKGVEGEPSRGFESLPLRHPNILTHWFYWKSKRSWTSVPTLIPTQ